MSLTPAVIVNPLNVAAHSFAAGPSSGSSAGPMSFRAVETGDLPNLAGDVTGSPGSTTVSTVGTSTAANVHAAEVLANTATDANTASTIVKRDASGNFTAGTITASLTGTASGNRTNNQAINAQTGTTYTLVLTDAELVTLANAAAITLTVPTNASVAFAVGTTIDLAQLGAGQVNVSAAGGVTLNSFATLTHLAGQFAAGTLVKTATDAWLLIGNLA